MNLEIFKDKTSTYSHKLCDTCRSYILKLGIVTFRLW